MQRLVRFSPKNWHIKKSSGLAKKVVRYFNFQFEQLFCLMNASLQEVMIADFANGVDFCLQICTFIAFGRDLPR